MTALWLIIAAIAPLPAYMAAGLRWPWLPYTGWLERIPAPRLPRLRMAEDKPRFNFRNKLRLRMPRSAKRGQHHADSLRLELGTGTIPRAKAVGRPPWNTAPLPQLRETEAAS